MKIRSLYLFILTFRTLKNADVSNHKRNIPIILLRLVLHVVYHLLVTEVLTFKKKARLSK